jgi:molybdate transport system substrate-binding protein
MRALILFAAILALTLQSCSQPPEELNIGAAPVLIKPLDELAKEFKGCKVSISYAASGQIAQQVRQGAPFDLLILADKDNIEALAREGFIAEGSIKVYARTKLVVWTPEGENHPRSFEDLAQIPGKIAVANPDVSPYGKAAVQALQSSGLWEGMKSKLVYAENVSQALQYAEAGDASAAIVSLSLIIDLKGYYFPVPAKYYAQPEQALAIVKGAKHEKCAWDFIAYFLGPKGKEALERYGFEVVED